MAAVIKILIGLLINMMQHQNTAVQLCLHQQHVMLTVTVYPNVDTTELAQKLGLIPTPVYARTTGLVSIATNSTRAVLVPATTMVSAQQQKACSLVNASMATTERHVMSLRVLLIRVVTGYVLKQPHHTNVIVQMLSSLARIAVTTLVTK